MELDAENRENLPETYYDDMMNGATEDWINVHVHGQYGRSLAGRAVYEKTFKREFHVAKSELLPQPGLDDSDRDGLGRTPAAVIGQRHYTGAYQRVGQLV